MVGGDQPAESASINADGSRATSRLSKKLNIDDGNPSNSYLQVLEDMEGILDDQEKAIQSYQRKIQVLTEELEG